jgi:hypothetical protein
LKKKRQRERRQHQDETAPPVELAKAKGRGVAEEQAVRGECENDRENRRKSKIVREDLVSTNLVLQAITERYDCGHQNEAKRDAKRLWRKVLHLSVVFHSAWWSARCNFFGFCVAQDCPDPPDRGTADNRIDFVIMRSGQ